MRLECTKWEYRRSWEEKALVMSERWLEFVWGLEMVVRRLRWLRVVGE